MSERNALDALRAVRLQVIGLYAGDHPPMHKCGICDRIWKAGEAATHAEDCAMRRADELLGPLNISDYG